MIDIDGITIMLTREDIKTLAITDADGQSYELDKSKYIEFTAKFKSTDATSLIYKVTTDGAITFNRLLDVIF